MRLLRCTDCMTLEELPDFIGSVEEEVHDPLLEYTVSKHRGPLNREQLRRRPSGSPRVREIKPGEEHFGTLMRVAPDDWIDRGRREAIIRQIWADHTGYPDEFYATKNTFQEDAAYCFNKHGRPKEGCIDWQDDSKRLTPVNWRERHNRHVFLCNFCVVQSWVTTQVRLQRGDYNKHPGETD